MTASELIAELSKLPPDKLVYVWMGDRHEALDIDDSLLDQGFIDINTGE
jgi:hypothetical protein